MKTYLDLLKLLPKTNCGLCGEKSCLLFALKVLSKELLISKCPFLNIENLPEDISTHTLTFNQLLENLKYLKEKFRSLKDFSERAVNLGGSLSPEKNQVILPYLDLKILIECDEKGSPQSLENLSKSPLDPRDEILIYNYFLFNGKSPLSSEYVGLESFPHSLSKVKTLKKYAEDPLAEILSLPNLSPQKLLSDFEVFNLSQSSSMISFIVMVLPKVFLQIFFWYGEEEEGLPSSCKILYDKNALSYLDLECLVFCAERFVERFKEKLS